METTDLDQLQDDILSRYNRDGALEFLLGLGLILGGLRLLVHGNMTSPMTLALFVIILAARAWRRRITYPRLGYIELLATRRHKWRVRVLTMWVVAPLLIALAAMLYKVAGGAPDDPGLFEHREMKLVFGSIIALIIAMVGGFHRMKHLYLFAALLWLLIFAAYALNLSGGYALLTTGAALLITGLVRLRLFLRDNPKLEEEAHGSV
ncbi:MAG TPA: hypothetical protein VGL38_11590 [bacterium]